jgi:hypothetical protein
MWELELITDDLDGPLSNVLAKARQLGFYLTGLTAECRENRIIIKIFIETIDTGSLEYIIKYSGEIINVRAASLLRLH